MKSGASESSYVFLEEYYKFPNNFIVSHLPQELQQSNKQYKVLWTQHSYDQPHYLNFDFSICDLIVSPSNWCREQFIKYHHIPENKIVTIPTGVSKKFTYSNKKSKTFIYTSIPYKGLEVLAQIIPHIPEATFKIFSAMNLYDIQEDPYTELYEYLKSLPNVIYSPAVDQAELISHLQDAAFFIHPNIWEETFCVSLAEAMACGCYPILSDIGALPEVSNEIASIVPMEGIRTSKGYEVTNTFLNNFISACKDSLHIFESDRQYYTKISREISDYSTKKYDWKIISKQWENAMNSLLNKETEQVYFRPQSFDDWIYDEVYTQNIYEVNEFGESDIVVDIGAHSGYFAKLCMDKGCKNIHCFEPEPDNFQCLVRNLSSYSYCQAYQLAVYKEMGTASFCVVPGENTGLHSLYDRGGIISEVNTVSLDDILLKLPKISLLKIDTEGSEFEILMNSKLLNKVDKIVGEYHNDLTEYNLNDLIKFLEENNFEVFKIKKTNSTSGTFFASHK
jgi:FkbM family methyltransferase